MGGLVRILMPSKKYYRSLPGVNKALLPENQNGYILLQPDVAKENIPEYSALIDKLLNLPIHESELIKRPKPGAYYVFKPRDPAGLVQYQEVLEFALSPTIIASVTEYLGEVPYLGYASIWHTVENDLPFQDSQFYHFDHDASRQLKVFVYLDDVGIDNGPLTFIPAKRSEEISEAINYDWKNHHVPDNEFAGHLKPQDEVKVVVKSGSVVFADTSRMLHYGGRVNKGRRRVLVLQYLPRVNYAFSPFFGPSRYPYRSLSSKKMQYFQRFVLSGKA